MRQFAYVVRPAFDSAFMATAGERVRTTVDEHWAFLQELHRSERLVFVGRCFDGPFGIVVIEVESESEARSVMSADPSVQAGVQTAELFPFKVGLMRGDA